MKVQGRPVDFNVSEDKKFNDMTSDSTLQIILKSLSSVNSDLVSNKNTKLSEKTITIFLPFTSTYLCDTGFSENLLQPKHYTVTSEMHKGYENLSVLY